MKNVRSPFVLPAFVLLSCRAFAVCFHSGLQPTRSLAWPHYTGVIVLPCALCLVPALPELNLCYLVFYHRIVTACALPFVQLAERTDGDDLRLSECCCAAVENSDLHVIRLCRSVAFGSHSLQPFVSLPFSRSASSCHKRHTFGKNFLCCVHCSFGLFGCSFGLFVRSTIQPAAVGTKNGLPTDISARERA